MSDTPRTALAFKESIQWDFPADYMRGKMEELERELSIESAEKMKYRARAWRAESQLEQRFGLRKEISAELGLADETGDDALRKGLETIKALNAELNGLKAKCKAAYSAPSCSTCAKIAGLTSASDAIENLT